MHAIQASVLDACVHPSRPPTHIIRVHVAMNAFLVDLLTLDHLARDVELQCECWLTDTLYTLTCRVGRLWHSIFCGHFIDYACWGVRTSRLD